MSLIVSPSISDEDLVVVAAERVVAIHGPRRVWQLVKIARVLVVVEDDLLVELTKIGHVLAEYLNDFFETGDERVGFVAGVVHRE